MRGFRVAPDELSDRAERLRSAAGAVRGVAAGGFEAGPALQGGLDDALERFAERWRDGHGRLAERTEDVAARLLRAAEVYGAVDRQVARGAGA